MNEEIYKKLTKLNKVQLASILTDKEDIAKKMARFNTKDILVTRAWYKLCK